MYGDHNLQDNKGACRCVNQCVDSSSTKQFRDCYVWCDSGESSGEGGSHSSDLTGYVCTPGYVCTVLDTFWCPK